MIYFIILFNRQGKIRLQKWYTPYLDKVRLQMFMTVLNAHILGEAEDYSRAGDDGALAQAEDVRIPRVQGVQSRLQAVSVALEHRVADVCVRKTRD